ncbi:MAG: WG repeat-containing protein [Dysgonamonadaceae bacterium]|jgi:hypothetical protein|nr:WG repeat-containing protein [Dysgonamonadaceae bacterium]
MKRAIIFILTSVNLTPLCMQAQQWEWIVQPKYTTVEIKDSLAKVGIQNGKETTYLWLDSLGREVAEPEVKAKAPSAKPAAKFQKEGKLYGVVDSLDQWIVRPQFKNHRTRPLTIARRADFYNGVAAVQNEKGLWGLIDQSGHWLVEPQYKDMGAYYCGMAPAKNEKDWGYVDAEGKWIANEIAKTEKDADPETYAGTVTLNGRPLQYSRFGHVYIHGLWVKFNGEWFEPSKMGRFTEGLAYVFSSNRIGFVDTTRNWVLKPIYENVADFRDGQAWVRQDGRWGIIDREGNWIKKLPINSVEIPKFFSEGLALLSVYDYSSFSPVPRYGYADTSYHWVIGTDFREALPFSEGVAGVMNSKVSIGGTPKYGFINRSGNWVIEPQFDGVVPFFNGVAVVTKKKNVGLIDHAGAWVIEPEFDNMQLFYAKTFWLRQKDKWGLVRLK